jgi:hypothetical protein
MAIVGDHPETGLRIVLERGAESSPPYRYEGFVYLPLAPGSAAEAARFALRAEVGPASVEVTAASAEAPAPPALLAKVRLLLRSLAKAEEDGSLPPPPRRIVRWRGDK